jgi:HPt (histidine-containing phosphotransfer) domain-containing protein
MSVSDFASFPLIDREQFDMLVATGEADAANMLTELMGLFTAEADPKFDDMRKAAVDLDRSKYNKISHALAGASANLGCLRLSKVCREYEHGAKDALSQADLIQGVTDIQNLYRISVTAMNEEIAKIGK